MGIKFELGAGKETAKTLPNSLRADTRMTPKEPLKTHPEPGSGSDDSNKPGCPKALDREIANRLQMAREDQGLSPDEIAARIGVPVKIYAQLEAAKRRIDAWHLSKLAMALDLPIAWFLLFR